jgi:hypothetical protein
MLITSIRRTPEMTEKDILDFKKIIQTLYGGLIKLRGRHSNRKLVLGNKWSKGRQNDIPWRLAEQIAFYKIK